MTGVGKARVFHTVGELRVVIKDIPDDTKFYTTMGDDEEGLALEIWDLTEDDDPLSYELESLESIPNYRRLTIEDADSVVGDKDEEEDE